ncbi:exodeoxyribonuclease V subunit beta [Marinomonas ostreistagni]|uniref:exodeoxyribonuclease V subunit beta n=1 Tax=Marinomonas ostreistagni TaxID=359209 RepID=UPI0019526336|nr:exodeoxyribonuclease V subunit beta [Marinomonas ostreistagni]MBM6550516.1 exodeoxyribonuclease V subunit beta [Marinomonas ostreistagni]
MEQQVQQLDALTFPLSGSALIEASAGTGKTYTLALLYLRLVLKHGGTQSFDEYLLPPNILVVTFTKAATRELRDRIRARLVEAAAYFRGDSEVADPQLSTLKQDVAAQQDLNAAARRLEVAAEWMDEAAVSTIHSWCSRILSEHAFYSGLNFTQTLIEDEKPLIMQACEDYWREMVFPLDESELRQVLTCFKSPADLYQTVNKVIYKVDAIAPVPMDISTQLEAIAKEREATVTELKQAVQQALPILQSDFEAAAKQKLFKATSLNAKHRATVFEGLAEWSQASGEALPMLEKLFQGKSFAKIALLDIDFWQDPSHIPVDRGAAQTLVDLQQAVQTLITPLQYLISHSSHWVAERVVSEKLQRGALSQNDLLIKLDQALQNPGGERLAEVIRKQFPVALVDEFQDTDPVQYRIFNTIYNVAEPHPHTGFFMIGDPKQAIYRFRGADIFTYLAAKQDTGQRQFTLTHNYRSAPTLVQAVNRYFEHADKVNQSAGAFLFKQQDVDPIPFLPVQSGREGTRIALLIDGEPVAPQHVWDLATPDEDAPKWDRAVVTANEITSLLHLSQQGRAQIDLGKGAREILPKDFAVLVNSGNQARQIRRALFELNVASVYLSDASDVFDTEEADDILRVLRAMAEPYNSYYLRIALGSRLMGLSLYDLDRLNHDEVFWEGFIEQFRSYHHHWLLFGVMATLHRFFKDQRVTSRYLESANGERSITDLFHISELLQQASETVQGQQALIHYLEQCITSENASEESRQQRLESDADLVQVVTVHKSKGLQYPLVMLPYLDYARPTKASDVPIEYHQADGRLSLTFTPEPEEVAMADFERLAEDVRKVYVAMTRAICAQWVGIEDPQGTKDNPEPELSSAGHVLAGRNNGSVLAQYKHLKDVFSIAEPKLDQVPYKPLAEAQPRPARRVQDLAIEPWWIASYSSISYGGKSEPMFPQSTATELAIDEQLSDDDSGVDHAEPTQKHATKLMHCLPRGSFMGTFLHGLIEWAAQHRFEDEQGERLQGFAAAVADHDGRHQLLETRCRKRDLASFAPGLADWLADFLATPFALEKLTGKAEQYVRLMDLAPQQISVELEFMLAANEVKTTQLDQLVRRHTWQGQERPMANFQQLQGMLKGFIDLVAEIDGQYFVIDWKSNYLGNADADYHAQALQEALLKKRYDLQYVLYLLALHRHLKERIPDYRYDQHIGGAVYFFLRGYEHPDTQGLVLDKPPRELIEQLDAMFSGAAHVASDASQEVYHD